MSNFGKVNPSHLSQFSRIIIKLKFNNWVI